MQEYIALRQTYLVRCTAVPGDDRPTGGASATPLLTPSMAPSRSPMKHGLAVAHSPTRRGSGGAAAAALGLLKSASSGTLGRTVNRLKLPRRNASRAGESREGRRCRPPACLPGPGTIPQCLPVCAPFSRR